MRWGLFFLLILFFAVIGCIGWVIYTQVRARRAGLPPPTWKSYIPFTSAPATYRDSSFPSPRRGGVVGWVKDKIESLRNKRTYRGAYEEPTTGGPGPYRGAGADHDEAWDTRVGALEDGPYGHAPGPYGHYDEQDFGRTPRREPYDSAGYDAGLTRTDEEPERGRSRSRDPGPPQEGLKLGDTGKPLENPFEDHNASSLRDVSPRPEPDPQTGK
ncbi:hypothetical protein CIHG_08388 [Coccidioides immitis H538.4]|uniref:Uncharacterized protein n=3 Tax=Coccidioides immitis TaxID=5501 RepID=A0A0J8QX36_COCIT|nr:hypothetical protein CIRG_06443 [Coccidioides immitis RMSCC 2394]KMU77006.1 hypothetical protein CISG_06241 [Coccidioides immitis RMSCC 3703]KMU90499.1 hypothetical protein CIHG_08388 [Coccidioides immitis H538.4]TPX22349.1 hypothetical protein DIZ76_014220 [Coccidioides immitis]